MRNIDIRRWQINVSIAPVKCSYTLCLENPKKIYFFNKLLKYIEIGSFLTDRPSCSRNNRLTFFDGDGVDVWTQWSRAIMTQCDIMQRVITRLQSALFAASAANDNNVTPRMAGLISCSEWMIASAQWRLMYDGAGHNSSMQPCSHVPASLHSSRHVTQCIIAPAAAATPRNVLTPSAQCFLFVNRTNR